MIDKNTNQNGSSGMNQGGKKEAKVPDHSGKERDADSNSVESSLDKLTGGGGPWGWPIGF